MIGAVIFDMDGLLIDSEPFWRKVEHQVFGELGINITPSMHVETYGLGLNEVIKHWYHYKPWKDASPADIKQRIVREVTDLILTEGVELPGVDSIIRFFREREIPLALASASPMSMIEAVIEKLGLHDIFQFIHSCEYESHEKPHPAIYLSVANMFQLPPASCLVFEDSLVGLIAAKSARMNVVAIPHPNYYNDPRFSLADIKISSLLDFNQHIWHKFHKDTQRLSCC